MDSFEPSSAEAPRAATHILAQASNSDVFITKTKLTVKCPFFSAQIPIFCSCLLEITIFGNCIPSCWKNNHCWSKPHSEWWLLALKSQYFVSSVMFNPIVKHALHAGTYVFTLQMKRWLGNLWKHLTDSPGQLSKCVLLSLDIYIYIYI